MRSTQVEITSPCHESWDAMNGDAERRFCGVCQKDVHNLSAMRHDEAQALLRERASESLCVRYSAEGDGSLRFRDLVPRASLTRKIVRAAFAAVMLAACSPHGDGPPIDNLGDAVIDSVRQDTVPTADGGCDYHTGPFTTVHLPPGHLLCKQSGHEVAQTPTIAMGNMPPPPVETEPTMGEAMAVEPPPPPVVDPGPPQQVQGQMVANPEPVEPFVPCDPNPSVAPPPLPDEQMEDRMGDIAAPEPKKVVRPRMGKPTLKPMPSTDEEMGTMIMPNDDPL
ncbi:MAG: hypothetical protein H0T76_03275 [Nannocystis sp.]|nr:hypothetical protein [Nannocystis sp.]MBA3545484.1 hypothetical protein [Nannocystis sp.]